MAGMESQHEHEHGHGMWFCTGEPKMKDGGSWIGHFFPGFVFLIWGLHWMQGTYRAYFASLRSKSGEYRASTTYTLWRFPHYSESVCKAFFPFIAISLELYFAHSGGYRNLICPADSLRAGHFDGAHLGNWQHAAMYPAFILAGIVDLVGYQVELPPGTQQVFLFLAFLCEAALMGLHKKHAPLDTMVHSLLFYAMLSNAIAVLLEAIYPRHFLISCARIGTTFLQCGWFWAATRMMFEQRPAWDDMQGEDMGPVMMAPVFFVGIIIVILVGMLLAYLAFYTFYTLTDAMSAANTERGGSPSERSGLLEEDRHDPTMKTVPLSVLPGRHGDV